MHVLRDDLQAIHETIDATPFGMWALDSMRIEKGHPAWGSDLSPAYTLRGGGRGTVHVRSRRSTRPCPDPSNTGRLRI
ncbi:hypothetical protein [Jannaschia rubra]|uniref:hypothetical protein n=1 Tax=Jannaschia rubra TaxID=282197 RepID=UPI002490B6C6|nr:hypothetical protein [Jannaschia rubra]